MRWPVRHFSLLRVVFALASLLLACSVSTKVAHAQAKTPPPLPIVLDEEALDSPRVSMRNFFELAERGRYQEASHYLAIPRGSQPRAAELASKLHAVLSQRLLVNPETLSPLAQGRTGDGLPPGMEELGKISDAKGRPIAIRLVRHESRSLDDESRWVFSQSTVAAVPALYGALRDRWIRERLPPSLLTPGPMSLYYWQWLALPIVGLLCLGLGRLLSFLSGIVARRTLAKHTWSPRLLSGLKAPVTLGWAIVLFAIAIPYLALTLRAEDLVERALRALAYLTFFWALLRAVVVFGDQIASGDWARSRPSARTLSAVGVSLGKVVVASIASMVALSELGYPVTSVIAGLGIGGVALALAAQRTVENLFGSISILVDQPFRVGDVVRVDSIEGTVESIGLRSTRIRTLERTLIVFPNGKLAAMRIESLGPRDRIRFATRLQLSRTTTTAHIRAIVAELQNRLATHPLVRKEDISVRLTGFGESSYDVDVSTTIETLEASEFAQIREELLVMCIEIVEKSGSKLAVPARQVLASHTVAPDHVSTPTPAPLLSRGSAS